MQKLSPLSSLPLHHARPIATFNVVTVCEDLQTARDAWRAFDHFKGELGEDTRFNHGMWLLEIFQRRELIEAALGEAENIDFVLLSIRNDRLCPPEARAFVRAWTHQRNRHGSLCVVTPPPCNGEDACLTRLRQLASGRRLNWLEQKSETEEELSLPRLFWVFGGKTSGQAAVSPTSRSNWNGGPAIEETMIAFRRSGSFRSAHRRDKGNRRAGWKHPLQEDRDRTN